MIEPLSVDNVQNSRETSCPGIRRFVGRFAFEEQSITQGEEERGPVEQAQHEEAIRDGDADFEVDAAAVSQGEPLEVRCDPIITLYMREIGRVKLLTPLEEIKLAARIKNGDAKAREQMIKANLRLVVKIARGYERLGMPLLDLINEGNIGLMKAVERFDPGKGGEFSTYSSCWIKNAITRALACQSKVTRLPTHAMAKLYRMRRPVTIQVFCRCSIAGPIYS